MLIPFVGVKHIFHLLLLLLVCSFRTWKDSFSGGGERIPSLGEDMKNYLIFDFYKNSLAINVSFI